ncbi:MAG: hypothetical protein AAGA18_15470 [Verrucomicrobiota bacterium]
MLRSPYLIGVSAVAVLAAALLDDAYLRPHKLELGSCELELDTNLSLCSKSSNKG